MPFISNYTLLCFFGEIQNRAISCSDDCNTLSKYLHVVRSAGKDWQRSCRTPTFELPEPLATTQEECCTFFSLRICACRISKSVLITEPKWYQSPIVPASIKLSGMPKIRTRSCDVETANDYTTFSFFR